MYVRNRSLIPANKNGRFLSEITQMNPEDPRPPGNPTRLLAIRGDFGWEMIGTQLKLEIVGDTWRYPMFHDVSISSGQCFWQGCMQKLVDYAISFPSFWIQMMLLLFLSRTVVKSSWHIDSKIFLTFAVSSSKKPAGLRKAFATIKQGQAPLDQRYSRKRRNLPDTWCRKIYIFDIDLLYMLDRFQKHIYIKNIYPLVNKHRPWKSPILNGN